MSLQSSALPTELSKEHTTRSHFHSEINEYEQLMSFVLVPILVADFI